MAAHSNTKAMLSIDADLWQVPYEKLKRDARDRKAFISTLQGVSNKVAKLSDAGPNAAAATKSLQDLQVQLQASKEQHTALTAAEQQAINTCLVRQRHAAECANTAQRSIVEWNQLRLPRLMVDYLLRCGHFDVARQLSDQLGCGELCEWPVFEAARKVVAALHQEDCQPALEWCGRHAARLRKLGSPLLFRLRLQEFVSLIRRDERAAALAHARAHLQEFAREPENFAEFRTAFALLVIPRGTKCPRYARLLAPARWRALAELFVRELLSVHGLCTVPLLELQLQAGLTALKCPLSYEPTCTREDPMHVPELRALARDLPWAKHEASKLVCALSRDAIDDGNPPLMLPNGRVYGRAALERMAAERGGEVVCAETGEAHAFAACVPVYVM